MTKLKPTVYDKAGTIGGRWRMDFALRRYYSELLPVDTLESRLPIAGREVAFVTQAGAYIRNLKFDSWAQLRDRMVADAPAKVDLGPIRTPKGELLKELVIDIDATDYPRPCCEGTAVCRRCWPLVAGAVVVVDMVLRSVSRVVG